MKERPILFSGPMVRAILEGRKTQTRRVVKLRDGEWIDGDHIAFDKDGKCGVSLNARRYPYGTIGDRLWVRESFCQKFEDGRPVYNADGNLDCTCCYYRADGVDVRLCDGDGFSVFTKSGLEASPWRPSIHMPRWASRITLEITGVRVERLKEISEKDAIAEGIESRPKWYGSEVYWKYYGWLEKHDQWSASPIHSYESLWQSINGPESWAANPWVWVIEFRRVATCGK